MVVDTFSTNNNGKYGQSKFIFESFLLGTCDPNVIWPIEKKGWKRSEGAMAIHRRKVLLKIQQTRDYFKNWINFEGNSGESNKQFRPQ